MPSGRTGAPVRSARAATPSCAAWSAPSRLRVPSGKTNRIWPSSRIRFASRNASTSAAPRSTGWTPLLAATQPTMGQSNNSFLPSQWMRRPSFGISHAPRTTGVEVGGVVGGEDERSVARDLVDGALEPGPAHRPHERPPTEGRSERAG